MIRLRAAAVVLATLLCGCQTPPDPSAGGGGAGTPSSRPLGGMQEIGTPTRPDDGGRRVRIRVGSVPVRVRVARSAEERRRGLKGVRSLADDEGMLFVYGDSRERSFWMKGCLIALDIAFLDARGTVLGFSTLEPPARGAPDHLVPAAVSPGPARYVLEVPGGFFDRHGLGAGTTVRIPREVTGPGPR